MWLERPSNGPRMPSLLPQQIPPITVPIAKTGGMMEQNWWLFLYNLAQNALGNQNSSSGVAAVQLLTDVNTDAETTDFLPLFQRVANLEGMQSEQDPQSSTSLNALQVAQSDILPDPAPRAQPIKTITPGASPY